MNYKYEKDKIYANDEKGELMAKADFCVVGKGIIDIAHVYTNPVLRGQGVAGQLMEAVVEYMRENNLKAVASCSYAYSWLQKYKDIYADVIATGKEQPPMACKIDGQHE